MSTGGRGDQRRVAHMWREGSRDLAHTVRVNRGNDRHRSTSVPVFAAIAASYTMRAVTASSKPLPVDL